MALKSTKKLLLWCESLRTIAAMSSVCFGSSDDVYDGACSLAFDRCLRAVEKVVFEGWSHRSKQGKSLFGDLVRINIGVV